MEQEGVNKVKMKRLSWWKKGIIILIILTIGMPVGLSVALQFPAVQIWTKNKITTYLSKKLNADVSMERVDLDIFQHIYLDGVLVRYPDQDTLFRTQNLKVTLKRGLFSLLRKRLNINTVWLNHAHTSFTIDEVGSSWTKLVRGIGKQPAEELTTRDSGVVDNPDPVISSAPFNIEIGKVLASHLQVNIHNKYNESRQEFSFPDLEVDFKEIDLENQVIIFDKIKVVQPIVDVSRYGFGMQEIEEEPTYEFADFGIDTNFQTSEPMRFLADEVILVNGHFLATDERFPAAQWSGLDYRNLDIHHINFKAHKVGLQRLDFSGNLEKLSAETTDGFSIRHLACNDVEVTSNHVLLPGFTLLTDHTTFEDSLELQYNEYSDWLDFVNRIRINGKFDNAKIAIKDITLLASGLSQKKFFKDNFQKDIILSGHIHGRINRLIADDLRVKIGNQLFLSGNFGSRDLTYPNETLLNIEISELQSTMSSIRLLFPDINFSNEFNKLGALAFEGRFDGYLQDFVAYGNLNTNLGRAEVDMRLNAVSGSDLAEYSGLMKLIDFDLGKWLENPSLKTITMSAEVKNGRGLSKETLDVDVNANIETLSFMEYTYQNAVLNGRVQRNLFDGDFSIADQNIDLSFKGIVDFSSDIPNLDFQANIEKMATKYLNLTDKDLVFSGQVGLNIDDIDLNRFVGHGSLRNLLVEEINSNFYSIQNVDFSAAEQNDKTREIVVSSDLANANLKGKYELTTLLPLLKATFAKNYPEIGAELNWDTISVSQAQASNFTFNANVADSKDWLHLFGIPVNNLTNASINASFDSQLEYFNSVAVIPNVQYDNSVFNDIKVEWSGEKKISKFDINLGESDLNAKIPLQQIQLSGIIQDKLIDFNLASSDFLTLFNSIDLDGQVEIIDTGFLFRVNPSDLFLFGNQWIIHPDNQLFINKNRFIFQDFNLRHQRELITLEEYNEQGLKATLDNFELGWIDSIWNYERLNFSGAADIQFSTEKLIGLKELNVKILCDHLYINEDDFGELMASLGRDDKANPMAASIKIENDFSRLTGNGFVYPKDNFRNQTELDLTFELLRYPVSIAEYFLSPGVKETEGELSGSATLFGPMDNLALNGKMKVMNGKTTVSYLGTSYYFHDQDIDIRNNIFDFSKVKITDFQGNRANITGGIYHDYFKNFRLNVGIASPKLIALNTTKRDNNIYYGFGIGRVNCNFSGPFKRIDILVDAQTSSGSKLAIPINTSTNTSIDDFITFTTFDSTGKNRLVSPDVNQNGLDVKMDLRITPDAEISIIFDEFSGDILKASGRGDITIEAARTGNLEMRGLYEIVQGDYLFTLLNVIYKPFELKKGGTIRWSGDPYNAEINVSAEYKGLSASLASFLEEYRNQVQNSVNVRTPVRLSMDLTGDLLSPDIAFDISFPQLTGELKNYAENKLSLLKSDPNALNQQVLGLIVSGTFIPTNTTALSNQFISNSGANTISQFLSNQLSLWVTDLISEAVADYGFISGIDFDFGWNLYPELSASPDNLATAGSEINLKFNNRLFDDRLAVGVGANVVNNSPLQQGSYVTSDLNIEYFLTEDRRLKVRFYQRPEESIEGRKTKFGLGLIFRKEFDRITKQKEMDLNPETKDVSSNR